MTSGRTQLGLAIALVACAAFGTFADVLDWFGVTQWFGTHQLASTFISEAVLLGGTYLVIDQVAEQRDRRRWQTASRAPLQHLAVAGYDVLRYGLRHARSGLEGNPDGSATLLAHAVEAWNREHAMLQPLLAARTELAEIGTLYARLGQLLPRAVGDMRSLAGTGTSEKQRARLLAGPTVQSLRVTREALEEAAEASALWHGAEPHRVGRTWKELDVETEKVDELRRVARQGMTLRG